MAPHGRSGSAALRAAVALAVDALAWYEASRAGDAGRLLPGASLATVDDVVGTAALLSVWGLLAWVALVLTLNALAAAPGAIGRVFARAAQAVTPGVLRRLAAVTLGVSLAGTGSSALASTGALPQSGGQSAEASASVTSASTPVAHAVTAPPSVPAVGASTAPPPVTDAPPLDRPAGPRVVTVEPGDCLWDIAERTLGDRPSAAAVAAEWPRWYAANRAVIGSDPDLVLPGQRLVEPD